jgi:hypothetical protein
MGPASVRAPFPRRVPLLAELGTELPCDSRPGEFCFVTATQSLSVDYENAVDALGKDTETACIYVAGINGLDNLTGVERYRFFVMWFHVLRAAEQLHFYSLEGMVDERIWRGYERQLDEIFRLPGVQQYWEVRKDWYSDEFQEFVEQIISRAPASEPERFSVDGCQES